MNAKRKSRIAKAAVVSAVGIGAVGFGLRTAPAVAQAAVAQNIAYFQKDGTYSGKREYAYYGYVKVQATVKNGTLTNVKVVEYPSDNRRSQYINVIALPYLIQEATDAQSYKVDFISGATFTSVAFAKSLREALAQAGS